MVISCSQYCGSIIPQKNKVSFNMFDNKLSITLYFNIYRPDLPRPIKVNLILPVTFIVLCVTLVMLPSLEQPLNLLVGILITCAGIPVYYACIKWKNKPTIYGQVSRSIERFCQIMFATVFVDDISKQQ